MQYLPSGKVKVFIEGKWSRGISVEEGQAAENAALSGANWREQLTVRIEEAAREDWRWWEELNEEGRRMLVRGLWRGVWRI